MKKKILIPLTAAMLALSACGDTGASEETGSAEETGASAVQTEAPETETAETTSAEIVTETSETAAATAETAVVTEAVTSAEETTAAGWLTPEGLSGTYADMNDLSFIFNGKKYTLGVTTYQDLLNDGVVFKKADRADDIVEPFDGSNDKGAAIMIDGVDKMGVDFINPTDSDMPLSNCVLSKVHIICDDRLPGLDIKPSGMVQFAFPYTLTKEELVMNSGEPTGPVPDEYTDEDDISHKAFYEADSVYERGFTGYHFFFADAGGALIEFRMSWMPQ